MGDPFARLIFPDTTVEEKIVSLRLARGPAARGYPSELGTQSWDFPMSLETPSPGCLDEVPFYPLMFALESCLKR
jgi:hypothetical protein